MNKKVTKTTKNNRNDLDCDWSACEDLKIAAKAAGEIGVETEIC